MDLPRHPEARKAEGSLSIPLSSVVQSETACLTRSRGERGDLQNYDVKRKEKEAAI